MSASQALLNLLPYAAAALLALGAPALAQTAKLTGPPNLTTPVYSTVAAG